MSQGIAFDLLQTCNKIGLGQLPAPSLIGDMVIEPIVKDRAYGTFLNSTVSDKAIKTLLKQLRDRASHVDGPGSAPSCPMRFRRQRSQTA